MVSIYRNTDMEFCGGRHECKATYSVEFNEDGIITSLDTSVLMNGGSGNIYMDLLAIHQEELKWVRVSSQRFSRLLHMVFLACGAKTLPGKCLCPKSELCRTIQLSLGNGSSTETGLTSEGTCVAVLNACNILVDTLRPVLMELQSDTEESASWEAVVQKVWRADKNWLLYFLARLREREERLVTMVLVKLVLELDSVMERFVGLVGSTGMELVQHWDSLTLGR
ncbi:hypothetical protein R1sor_026976 [Riccia sorocarpa]|uniref:Uncharacterized protein n=1 Tax=Riccia sorocarpa TaxID=122646 RepID=A0ABD3GCY7_9MARC